MTDPYPPSSDLPAPEVTLNLPPTAWQITQNSAIAYATALLTHYSFELGDATASQLVDHWYCDYQPTWICMAVIEALYLGRYKAISVEHILVGWQRRGRPFYHFSHEFERLVCRRFPHHPKLANYVSLDYSRFRVRPCFKTSAIAAPILIGGEPLPENLQLDTAIEQPPIGSQADLAASAALDIGLTTLPPPIHEFTSRPIHRFVPATGSPDFYAKLKAVLQVQDSRNGVEKASSPQGSSSA
ncbi:hypothetical protein [Neosynechococcus sphagnicola]|uniref:hypothetical protein n=1 Tax=Neosynechococcus sphagnicola TaxID=1501145 RepID=UPI00068A4BCD|nr:hypothetical protein [Neosynechococcus sphagnicola]